MTPFTDMGDNIMVAECSNMMSSNRALDDDCRELVVTDAAQNMRSAFSADVLGGVALYLASHIHEYLGDAVLVPDGEHWLAVRTRWDRCILK